MNWKVYEIGTDDVMEFSAETPEMAAIAWVAQTDKGLPWADTVADGGTIVVIAQMSDADCEGATDRTLYQIRVSGSISVKYTTSIIHENPAEILE